MLFSKQIMIGLEGNRQIYLPREIQDQSLFVFRPWANPRPPSPTLGISWDQFFLKPMTLIYQTCESAKKILFLNEWRPFFKMAAVKIDATLISAKMHVIIYVYTNLWCFHEQFIKQE